MPRGIRKKFKRHPRKPDQKFGSILIGRFVNQIMRLGKKGVAEKIVYNSLEIISSKTKQDPLEIFEEAIRNASPILEVKSRRVGGANYQIPIEVRGERRETLAMRWIIEAAKRKKGAPMAEKIAKEIMLAAKNEGDAIKNKENIYKVAEANKAFAHFAY